MTYFEYIITWNNGDTELLYFPDTHVTFKTTTLFNNECNLVQVNLSNARKIECRHRYKWENKQWICLDAPELVTNCCSAQVYENTDICKACKEHAILVPTE